MKHPAIILAGGRSTRMGRDKRILPVGDASLLELAVTSVRSVAGEVIVAGPPDNRPPLTRVRWVADCPDLAGPAAGIVAGLEASSHPWAWVLACDMPGVTSDLLAGLARRMTEDRLAVAPCMAGRWEPLCGVYARQCASLLRAEYPVFGGSVSRFLTRHRDQVLPVAAEELALFGPPDRLFTNVNTPAEYARFAGRRGTATAGPAESGSPSPRTC